MYCILPVELELEGAEEGFDSDSDQLIPFSGKASEWCHHTQSKKSRFQLFHFRFSCCGLKYLRNLELLLVAHSLVCNEIDYYTDSDTVTLCSKKISMKTCKYPFVHLYSYWISWNVSHPPTKKSNMTVSHLCWTL